MTTLKMVEQVFEEIVNDPALSDRVRAGIKREPDPFKEMLDPEVRKTIKPASKEMVIVAEGAALTEAIKRLSEMMGRQLVVGGAHTMALAELAKKIDAFE